MSKTIEIVLRAVDRGAKKGINAVRSAFDRTISTVQAFNKTANNGIRIMGGLESALGGVAGAYLGLQGISSVADLMEKGSNAAFTLEASLKAASRQFADTGSMQDWEAGIGRLSEKLQIYSENDLKLAAASTVDMTKRLGFTNEQMEELIRLTGDLSAGRTDLAGGIERVTAAMRGEAEASEYLGLTLNENYVKAWHEANNATGKAWKDLSDLEKAQVRYQVFLEQALPTQGKAAESVKTLGGAWQMTRTQIENAVTNNEDVAAAVAQLSAVLNENGAAIGELVGTMVSWAARMMELGLRNKDLILGIGKTVLAIYALVKAGQTIGVLTNVVKGLNAAFVTLTNRSVQKWATDTIAQMRAVRLSTMTLKMAFGSLFAVLAAFEIGWEIGKWLNQFDVVKKAGIGFAHALTMAWLKLKQVWAKMPWADGDMAERVKQEIANARETYKEMKADLAKKPQKKQEKEKTPQELQPGVAGADSISARDSIFARDKSQKKKEIPEWANAENDPDNFWGYRSPEEVAKEKKPTLEERYGLEVAPDKSAIGKGVNNAVNEIWKRIEDGKISGAANIEAALKNAGQQKHDVSVRIEDEKPRSEKTIALKFPGGQLRGSEDSVDAFLKQLEQAGMTA